MSKKTFKPENPALQYIDRPEDSKQPGNDPRATQDINQAQKASKRAVGPLRSEDIKEPSKDIPVEDIPMKPNPLYIETRSQRVNLLMQPSLVKAIKEEAQRRSVSMNELIHSVLENYLKGDDQ